MTAGFRPATTVSFAPATSAPAVSVLMSVYNGQRHLARAMQSILTQTFSDFEFIVVDDGSIDGSLHILRGFASQDARLRVLALPHVGLSAALNRGIAEARGELLARMDCDDESLPRRFEIQVKYLRQHPDVVVAGSQVLQIDEDGDPLGPMQLPQEHDKINESLLNMTWCMCQPSVMIRTHAIRDVGGYADIFPHADYDLFLKLSERGRIANLPDVLLKYRRHSGSITLRIPDRGKLLNSLQAACQRRGIQCVAPPNPYRELRENPRKALARRSRNMGWQALRAAYIKTARKHALRAVMQYPVSFENWRLFFCAMRGR